MAPPDLASEYDENEQWQDTIRLLKQVQSDYQGTRNQLEKVNQTLAEREVLISQGLQYALQTSRGYRSLRLMPFTSGCTASLMGRAVLGELAKPIASTRSRRFEVRCLGQFEVRSDWKEIKHWQSTKARSVFEFLVGRLRVPVIKDALMETLWPECDVQAANNNLKAAMHGVRKTLSSLFTEGESVPYILFSQGSYLINPDIELWVDVEEFERHWTTGKRFEREGQLVEAVKEFEKAEIIYRGDYLEDEPYEEWTLLRREALKDTYVIILSKLADYGMQTDDYEGCISYCQKILAKDKCYEDAYRRLITCYSRRGERTRAIRWYEICRSILKRELDSPPDGETTSLYHRLINNETV